MTQETLSAAAAEMSYDHMQHDVRSTTQMRRPPRMALPVSARESMTNVPAEDDMVVETRPTANVIADTVEDSPKTGSVPTVQGFFQMLDRLETQLPRTLTTPQRRRLRRAACGTPNTCGLHEDPERSMVIVGMAGVLVGFGVCKMLQPSDPTAFRGTAPMSSACAHVMDRLLNYVS